MYMTKVTIIMKVMCMTRSIYMCTCSLSTFPEVVFPPLPTTGANIEWVEGGVAATGELTISFRDALPSAHEVLG